MSRVTCLAMLCALHASALASPRSDPTQGRAVFTGASTPSATSIEINPAALGLGITDEAYISVTALIDHMSIQRRTLDLGSGALLDDGKVSQNLVSPGGMLAYVWHSGVGGRVTLGLAMHTSPAERFIEGEDPLRYYTLGGSHRAYAASIASSIRLGSRYYIGVTLSLRPQFLRLQYARDTAVANAGDPALGIDSDCDGSPCGLENPIATERYDVDVRSDWIALDNVVATVGFVAQIAKNVWFGLGYHTPPGLSIQNELTGTMDVLRAPRDGGQLVSGGSTVYLSQPASIDAEVRARISPSMDLHVGGRWEDLSRLQDYDVRGYGSVFPRDNIPEIQIRARGFHDSFAAWAGIDQVERDFPLIVGGRIGFETASLDDERTSPLTIAPASATLDAGLQYRFTRDVRVTPQVVLQATYGLQYFLKVDVTDSAFDPRHQLVCAESGFDYLTSACAAVRGGYALDTAAGEYQRIQQAARLAIRLTW
jgi:hypothetical protein